MNCTCTRKAFRFICFTFNLKGKLCTRKQHAHVLCMLTVHSSIPDDNQYDPNTAAQGEYLGDSNPYDAPVNINYDTANAHGSINPSGTTQDITDSREGDCMMFTLDILSVCVEDHFIHVHNYS